MLTPGWGCPWPRAPKGGALALPLPLTATTLTLGLHLSVRRLAEILRRHRDDDRISAEHFLESLLGICDSNHFNCKDRMLYCADGTLYVVLCA